MNNMTSTSKCLAVIVILFASSSRQAWADFVCGYPANLGSKVNSSSLDAHPSISADGLSIFFYSDRPGGHGNRDIWMATRETIDDEWNEAVNLGSTVNSSYRDSGPSISADGLTLFFDSDRPGGSGGPDVWMTTRATLSVPWSEPVNLGPTVNSSSEDAYINISADGLELYFQSNRPGGHGGYDIWVATRMTREDPWGAPVNLGPTINSSSNEGTLSISADGLALFHASDRPGGYAWWDTVVSTRTTTSSLWGEPVNLGPVVNGTAAGTGPANDYDLYFLSGRTGGSGNIDLWQVSFDPVVDLNGDSKVDSADMHIIVDHWGTDNKLCDVGPNPFGDGVVDIQDMIVLAEYLYRLTAHWKLDETEGKIAYDSFGDYDGTINGNPSWLPAGGIKGGSLMLDGIDDYIETPFILDPSKGSFSVFAWVYSWMPGQVIVSQTGESGGAWLGIDSSGNLMTGLMPPRAGWVNPQPLESESVITDIQWHHVGFIWDGSYRALYVDGIEVAKDNNAQNPLKSADGGLYIGAGKDLDAGTFFSGMIDDVRIYNQALTIDEIATLAQ